MEFALNAKPLQLYVPPAKSGASYRIWQLVTSSPFENFILLLITINTLILCMKWHNQTEDEKFILKYVNVVFTALFTFECLLKLCAFGPKAFSNDFWNIFDLITVIGSVIDVIVSEIIEDETGVKIKKEATGPYAYVFEGVNMDQKSAKINMGFLRLFRATRLIKLLRQSATIRVLLWTFIQSIKALPYVCLLIAMLFFLYAIIGMQIFGNIRLDPTGPINRHNNFQNVPQAVQLLFRCATGENWQEIMRGCLAGVECEIKPDEKHLYPTHFNKYTKQTYYLASNKKCGMDFAYGYFVSFVFFSTFLMLNLFVAVIMDNFDYLTRDASILGAHHLGEYITAWSAIDPAGIGRAHHSDILKMLLNNEPPMGFGNKCPKLLAYRRLIRMNMPVDENGTVHFTTTLFALIREALKIKTLNIQACIFRFFQITYTLIYSHVYLHV
jgi:voltage-dependent calcium channel N type alpha-1B